MSEAHGTAEAAVKALFEGDGEEQLRKSALSLYEQSATMIASNMSNLLSVIAMDVHEVCESHGADVPKDVCVQLTMNIMLHGLMRCAGNLIGSSVRSTVMQPMLDAASASMREVALKQAVHHPGNRPH